MDRDVLNVGQVLFLVEKHLNTGLELQDVLLYSWAVVSGVVGSHFLGLKDDDTPTNDSVLLLKLLN